LEARVRCCQGEHEKRCTGEPRERCRCVWLKTKRDKVRGILVSSLENEATYAKEKKKNEESPFF
jgi:hypothetical protein